MRLLSFCFILLTLCRATIASAQSPVEPAAVGANAGKDVVALLESVLPGPVVLETDHWPTMQWIVREPSTAALPPEQPQQERLQQDNRER